MARPFVNLALTIVALVIFEHMGWIRITGAGAAGPDDGAHIVDVLIVGVLMFEIGEICEVFFFSALVPIAGWMLMLLPLYCTATGYLRLEAARTLLPEWFSVSPDYIPQFVMSAIIGATRWHMGSRYRRKLYSIDEDQAQVRELEDEGSKVILRR